jgi:hypothetical protein
MPPRFAYWTILIDGKPTAFRAREQDELFPTFSQLKRTNQDVVMKWFARGRLWDSPEAERTAMRRRVFTEKRGPDWRPGGAHKDPRSRFKSKKSSRPDRPREPWPGKGDRHRKPWPAQSDAHRKPWTPKGDAPRDPRRPDKPHAFAKPWRPKPHDSPKSWQQRPGDPHRRRPRKRRDDEPDKS